MGTYRYFWFFIPAVAAVVILFGLLPLVFVSQEKFVLLAGVVMVAEMCAYFTHLWVLHHTLNKINCFWFKPCVETGYLNPDVLRALGWVDSPHCKGRNNPTIGHHFGDPESRKGAGSVPMQIFGYGILTFIVPCLFVIITNVLPLEEIRRLLNPEHIIGLGSSLEARDSGEVVWSIPRGLLAQIAMGSLIVLITAELSTLFSLHSETAPIARDSLIITMAMDVCAVFFILIFDVLDLFPSDVGSSGDGKYALSLFLVALWATASLVSLTTLVFARRMADQLPDMTYELLKIVGAGHVRQVPLCRGNARGECGCFDGPQ
ncbi:hypothetical protein V5T82_16815 [Magnetovibrio sp. PR-2]|uniref:hypothetical protein n=1 Tax=Magnetovibrio sp. PR-2 TaxID=3120356 RepID=UPI002FCE477B